jgi:hypothetical protein
MASSIGAPRGRRPVTIGQSAPALLLAQAQSLCAVSVNADLVLHESIHVPDYGPDNTGGNFNAPPVTNAQTVETATLRFDTCTSGQLSYRFADGTGRNGTIPLTRLTQNVTCSTTTPYPTNADVALSGNGYGSAATSGQGVSLV